MSYQAGMRFGRLCLVERTDFTKQARWLTLCDCGTKKDVLLSSLVSGKSKSCGCLRRELLLMKGVDHSRHPLYQIWRSMRERCNSPQCKAYPNYGGRGITVCKRWDSFAHFKNDMGARPSSGHSLERKNNNRGYTPSNTVWATRLEQSRNNRRNVLVTYRGETKVLKDWARDLNISYYTLIDRIKVQGLSPEEAFNRPIGRWSLSQPNRKN